METATYEQIKVSVKQLLGIDLNQYKDQQMCRRLDSWLIRAGAPNWDEYTRKLRANQAELSKFRDYLTINVSEFFRDADRWKAFQSEVLPALLTEGKRLHPGKGLRIWSAGCSIGAEPYTLAILLNEMAPNLQHYLLATDLDRGILQKARARGPYSADDVRNVSQQYLINYFDPGGPPYFFKEKVASRVKFKEQNLLQDPFENDFDLIVCRNVIIYFTTEAKASLYVNFQKALRPGGMLFLGGTEIIPRPNDIGLRNQSVSFYVKST
jgi:chemotaxis protein methyltransferase CheR